MRLRITILLFYQILINVWKLKVLQDSATQDVPFSKLFIFMRSRKQSVSCECVWETQWWGDREPYNSHFVTDSRKEEFRLLSQFTFTTNQQQDALSSKVKIPPMLTKLRWSSLIQKYLYIKLQAVVTEILLVSVYKANKVEHA